MSNNIAGAVIEIKAKTDLSELRTAITEFDGSTDAVNRLKAATQDLKGQIGTQTAAIRTLHQAQRVQNFEMLEGVRVMRSVHSLALDLNQVYQTQILRQIQNAQQTMQQQEAYDSLKGEIANVVNGLSVLGEKNTEVISAFQKVESEAKNLNSTQLTDIISQIENLKNSTKLTPEELKALNELEDHLKTIRDNTLKKEDAQNVSDFFGSFTQITTVGSSVGIFASQIKNLKAEITGLSGLSADLLLGGEFLAAAAAALALASVIGDQVNPQFDAFKKNLEDEFGKNVITDYILAPLLAIPVAFDQVTGGTAATWDQFLEDATTNWVNFINIVITGINDVNAGLRTLNIPGIGKPEIPLLKTPAQQAEEKKQAANANDVNNLLLAGKYTTPPKPAEPKTPVKPFEPVVPFTPSEPEKPPKSTDIERLGSADNSKLIDVLQKLADTLNQNNNQKNIGDINVTISQANMTNNADIINLAKEIINQSNQTKSKSVK